MQTVKWKNLGKTITLGGRKIRPGEVFEARQEEIPRAFRDLIKPVDALPKVEPRKFRHRRYKEGRHFDYDAAFSNKFKVSAILNPENACYMNHETWRMTSPKGLQGLETELVERAEQAVDLLEKIAQNFEQLKVTRRREGKPELSELPPELLKLRLEAEARQDILAEELDRIRGFLAEATAKEAAAKDELQLLRYGPQGSGRIRGGVLTEIDGQAVIVDADGTLRISCKKSPYHGMTVESYRRLVVVPFKKAQKQKFRAWNALSRQEQEQTQAPKMGCPVKWANLPARPAGV